MFVVIFLFSLALIVCVSIVLDHVQRDVRDVEAGGVERVQPVVQTEGQDLGMLCQAPLPALVFALSPSPIPDLANNLW